MLLHALRAYVSIKLTVICLLLAGCMFWLGVLFGSLRPLPIW